MYKVAWIPRFAAGVDCEAAWARWLAGHAEQCLELPGLSRYVQNTVVAPEGAARITDGIVGLACGWWPDREAFNRAVSSDAWGGLEAIEAESLDPVWQSRGMTAEIREQLMRQGLGAEESAARLPRAGSVKQVGILRFRHGIDPEDAFEYWRNVHGQFPLKVPELGHYVQNHATAAIDPSGHIAGRPAFDGFSEAYFADRQTMAIATSAPGWKELGADAPNLLDRDFRLGGSMDEVVVKAS